MPLGINYTSNITLQNITSISNSSNPIEFMSKSNTIIFGGYFYFIMLWVFAIIVFFALQSKNDQPLTNAMYSMGATTVISLLLRGMEIVWTDTGVKHALLSDPQNFMFPLIAIICAGLLIATKKD